MIGICQLAVETDKAANVKKALRLIGQAAERGCRIVVLPEMFNCPYTAALFPQYAERWPEGPTLQTLSRAAAEHQITLVGGSVPERDDSGNVYNTCFIFDAAGRLAGRHRKIHLFDVNITNGTVFQESATLTAGREVTVVTTPDITLGVAICYDVRFPELARKMAQLGAQLLVYPAAFGPVTGPAHWELLMRMRAVDNQVFVAAAAPALNPQAEYKTYGHSLVVNPWGEVIAGTDEQEGLLTAVLDLGRIGKVREELPVLRHRRPEIYP